MHRITTVGGGTGPGFVSHSRCMADPHYNERGYKAFARGLALSPQRCWLCGRPGATSVDHVPAIALHIHAKDSGCCELRPAHVGCNKSAGAVLGNQLRAESVLERVSANPSGVW